MTNPMAHSFVRGIHPCAAMRAWGACRRLPPPPLRLSPPHRQAPARHIPNRRHPLLRRAVQIGITRPHISPPQALPPWDPMSSNQAPPRQPLNRTKRAGRVHVHQELVRVTEGGRRKEHYCLPTAANGENRHRSMEDLSASEF